MESDYFIIVAYQDTEIVSDNQDIQNVLKEINIP